MPNLIRVDRGKDFLSTTVISALGALAVPVIDLPAYTPHLKGTIEALNNAVEKMLFASMPRYVHRRHHRRPHRGIRTSPRSPSKHSWNYCWSGCAGGTTSTSPRRWAAAPQWRRGGPTHSLYDVPAEQLAHFGLEDDGLTRVVTTRGVQMGNRFYIDPWMVGRGGTRVAVRGLPTTTHPSRFYLDGTHLCSAVLAEAASKEQIRAVRNARKAKARQLRADLEAAARLRRERFKGLHHSRPAQRLGALTEAEAEAELSGSDTSDLRRANPDYIPRRPVPDGWAPRSAQAARPARRRPGGERVSVDLCDMDYGRLPSERDDHFHRLDAHLVATDTLMRTLDNIEETIEAKAMMAIYGAAGHGKTMSVNAALRQIASDITYRLELRSGPTPRDIRHGLFRALGLPGDPPSRPIEFDTLLKETLSETFAGSWSVTRLSGWAAVRSSTGAICGTTATPTLQ